MENLSLAAEACVDAYSDLRHGIIWQAIDPCFDRDGMKRLCAENLKRTLSDTVTVVSQLGINDLDPAQAVECFVSFFVNQEFIALKHTRSAEPIDVQLSMSRRIGWSQEEICLDPQGALHAAKSAAEKTDVVQLANQGFLFFKVQLAHSPLHRSGMGPHAYCFPLASTELLTLGHFYTADPVALWQLEVAASSFEATCLSHQLKEVASECGGILRKVVETSGRAMLLYPASGGACDSLDATKWIFEGQHALRGIALKLLSEACKMHPVLGTYLLAGTSAPASHTDEALVHLLDVLLTKALRLQGLLPGGILTKGSTFVRDVGRSKPENSHHRSELRHECS